MTEPLIKFTEVTRSYSRGGETVHALEQLTLTIPEGDYVAVMGPSGSGKSTFLNLVGGLDRPTDGKVLVAGEDLGQIAKSDLPRFRADTIGFVFQGFNLLPVLTAVQNVELPLQLTPLSRAQRREQALRALKLVGLEDRVHHRPTELSGGQEQRVAIARALATDPRLILADEPTGDLDRASADAVLDLLGRLNEEFGKTIVMVTHDPLAAEHARRVVHLDKGTLVRVQENRAGPVGAAKDDPGPQVDGAAPQGEA